MLLPNDPRNPCIGCGPDNPIGLRLAFAREGSRVTTTLVVRPEFQGWPGRLHSGVLYTALLETANWTVYGTRGRVGLPTRTSALDARRWIAVGEALRLTGRAIESTGSPLKVAVVATDARGEAVATLEREYDLPSRSEFLQRMGYPDPPPELDGLLGD